MYKTIIIFSALLVGILPAFVFADAATPPFKTFVSVDDFAKLQSELAKKSVEVQLIQQELAQKTAEAQIHDISGTRPLKQRGSGHSGLMLQSIYRYQGKTQASILFDGQSITVKPGDIIAQIWQATEITEKTITFKHVTDNTMQILRVEG